MEWHHRIDTRKQLTHINAPIGVFDSGVGGLTVLRELQQTLPNESILYFGDTANLPYGTKTPSEILTFVRAILDWMVDCQAKMVIMACNTSSALTLEQVQAEYNIPILGVILPAARAAAHKGKRIGVIATPATAQSHAYRKAIQEISPEAKVWEVGCPEFVPLIENSQIYEPETRTIIQRYLHSLIDHQIDTLVYGCTHYPYLSPVICELLPPGINLINPAEYVVRSAKQELDLLGQHKEEQPSALSPETQFFVSDRPSRFRKLTARLLGEAPKIQTYNLSKSAQLSERP